MIALLVVLLISVLPALLTSSVYGYVPFLVAFFALAAKAVEKLIAHRRKAAAAKVRSGEDTMYADPYMLESGDGDSSDEKLRDGAFVVQGGSDYVGVRRYEPGDPIKHIHWKLSARNDRFFTKQFESTIVPDDYAEDSTEERDLSEGEDGRVKPGLWKRLASYIKENLPRILLCAACVAGLCVHVVPAFELAYAAVGVILLVTVLLYVASGSRTGALILFTVGTLIMALISFFGYPVSVPAYFVFVLAAALLFVVASKRTMAQEAFASSSRVQAGSVLFEQSAGGLSKKQFTSPTVKARKSGAEELSWKQQMCVAVAVCAAAFACAYLVLVPLHLPNLGEELAEDLQDAKLLEVLGMSETVELPAELAPEGYDPTARTANDEEADASYASADSIPEELMAALQEKDEDMNGRADAETVLSGDEAGRVWYNVDFSKPDYVLITIFVVVFALLAAGAGVFAAKQIRRKRFESKVAVLDGGEAAKEYYRLFVKNLSAFGFTAAYSATPYEFACVVPAERFPEFKDVTEVYVRAVYGGTELADEDLDICRDFYEKLPMQLKAEAGAVKFFFRSLWL